MKSFNEWMNEGRAPRINDSEYYFNKRVVCADGFSISIQANNGAYCHHRSCNRLLKARQTRSGLDRLPVCSTPSGREND